MDPYRIPAPCGKPRGRAVAERRRPSYGRPVTLEAELTAAIEAAARGAPPPDFATWALRLFAHQFEHNAPYRAFCARRGVTPATVACWEDVPAVPSAAFRRADLACGPAEAVFRTSGTTGGPAARGRHVV